MSYQIGSLVIDLNDLVISQEEREMIAHPLVGGVILFKRNYQNKVQLAQLCSDIRLAKGAPCLIMVDQEGGRVQRFLADFTALPSFGDFGVAFDREPKAACEFAKKTAFTMANELLSIGVDFSISPVLDLNKGMNTVIGDRAFHRDPAIVTTLGQHFITGMKAAGMAAVAKHFPGHGSVTADSHLELPLDHRDLYEVEQDDLQPFKQLANLVNGIMASHLLFPNIDKDIVGFSRYWIQTILRDKLQFKGAILSDDLHMQGANISSDASDRFFAAKEAGCDLILYCNDRAAVLRILDQAVHAKFQLPEVIWRQLMKSTYQ